MRRPLGRAVAAVAILMLGLVAAVRLPVTVEPEATYPELSVSLQLPASTDPMEVTREWVVAIEAAIRSLGQVAAIRGDVSHDGARLRVRFEPGTDTERKAARLLSSLDPLRSRLPERGRLDVSTGETSGDEVAFLSVTGPGCDERAPAVAEELRRVPGVREVTIWGGTAEETRVPLGPSSNGDAVSAAVSGWLTRPALGEITAGGRRVRVLSGSGDGASIRDLAIASGGRVLPLGRISDVTTGLAAPASLARFGGKRGVALSITKDATPLLAVDGALRKRARELSRLPGDLAVEMEWSAADPLRRLLRHLGIALLLATLGGLGAGFLIRGGAGAALVALSPSLALAGALNAFWLFGLTLNRTTLPALALGVASAVAVALAAERSGLAVALGAASSAALLPIAVSLGSGDLAPFLAEPARAFALAAAAASLGLAVLPPAGGHDRGWLSRPLGRGLRRLYRDPATVLLGTATSVYALFTLFGGALDPRGAPRPVDAGRLTVSLTLPQGATLLETEAAVVDAERRATELPGIVRTWGFLGPGRAWLFLELARDARSAADVETLKGQLEFAFRAGGAAVRISEGSGNRSSFGADLEERPSTDERSFRYRFLLRGADPDELQVAFERVRSQLLPINAGSIQAESAAATVRVDLVPRWEPLEAAALAARLRERSVFPESRELPGRTRRLLTLLPSGAPADRDDVPQRADLLTRPLATSSGPVAPAARFVPEERVLVPSLLRQSGRFVLPVGIAFSDMDEDARKAKRDKVDQSLRIVPLPAGCDLLSPRFDRFHVSVEKLRLLALAATVPLLLFAAAAFALDSGLAALAALLPGVAGLAAATPLLGLGGSPVDELTLLALAAALAGTLPLPVALLSRMRGRRLRSRGSYAVYRTARRAAPGIATGAALFALLVGGATIGAQSAVDAWVTPLRAAAAVGVAGAVAVIAVLPALSLAAYAWRESDAARRQEIAVPPVWSAGGAPALAVRSLTKRYAAGNVALRDVSFELGPGITGLLGPNGAGKTTLLRTLTGLLTPTRGQVRFHGVAVGPENLDAYRRRIGFLPQEFNAYPGFTAERFLDYWAIERGMEDARAREREIGELLRAVGLEEDRRRKVCDFSGGMRQRIGIARALLGAPPILIVDEPTTGLDIESRQRFRDLLLASASERVILLSTHLAGDVEATASRLLLLFSGRLLFDGDPRVLLQKAQGRVFEALLADGEVRDFSRHHRVTARVRTVDGIRVRAVARGCEPLSGREVAPSLEEAYLHAIDAASSA